MVMVESLISQPAFCLLLLRIAFPAFPHRPFIFLETKMSRLLHRRSTGPLLLKARDWAAAIDIPPL